MPNPRGQSSSIQLRFKRLLRNSMSSSLGRQPATGSLFFSSGSLGASPERAEYHAGFAGAGAGQRKMGFTFGLSSKMLGAVLGGRVVSGLLGRVKELDPPVIGGGGGWDKSPGLKERAILSARR